MSGSWTRRRTWGPDPIDVTFVDPNSPGFLLDVRRSWSGRPQLVLWWQQCQSCRQRPLTFVRR